MSLILMLVYWALVPALVLLAAMSLWRRAGTAVYKGLVVAGSAASLLGLLWLAEGETWLLDRQVRELCAKDGGVRVYETVELPATRFDRQGTVDIYQPGHGESSLGSAYIYREEKQNILSGNPEMWKTHYQIIRKPDNKLISEALIYLRRGGDVPGPWHDSYFSCPDLKDFGLVESTFRIQPQE